MRELLSAVICAALICAALAIIAPKKSVPGRLVSMLIGLFFLLSLLKPLFRLNLSAIDFGGLLNDTGTGFVYDGVDSSSRMLRQVITEQTCAYIVEKAASLGVEVTVTVELTDGEAPVPHSATVAGILSPYHRERLSYILENDLNIPKERQKWA